MRRTARLSDPRPGFTLVELLVAMALIIMIMAILSVAFQVGMDTLSQLKSIGGLSEQLRTAQAILERDLRADHLEDPTGSPMRVSAFLPRTPAPGNPNPNPQAWTGLNRGYFNIVQRHMGSGTTGVNSNEGMDGEITSWRGSSEVFPDGSFRSPGSHILRMTVQLSGQSAQEIFVADAPAGLAGGSLSSFTPPGAPNSVVSRWAEVVYFLRPNGQFTTSNDPNTPPLPMYTLHRRQRVLADGPVLINTTGPAPSGLPANFPDLSWRVKDAGDPPAAANRLNTPADITNPVNRLGGAADPTVPAPKAFPDPLLTADHPCISPPTHQWPTGPPGPA
ncbi:MAG TPA: prepilin-type N-terminal cleavage/methylation domain-containing protein, partial [Fimbriiglobus sp.]|nr:prepilin-type N-terminal cleavage/methylation domain-containing protein [Fimbriiglobus sp.]